MLHLRFWACMSLAFSCCSTMSQANNTSTDRVFYRFYLLNRLQPSLDLFSRLVQQESLHKNNQLQELLCSFQEVDTTLFLHPVIQASLQHMCKHHDSAPLIKLIKTVGHYRYLHDDEYVREVVMLLLLVYKNILRTVAPEQELALLGPMPLNVLLDTLDTAVETLEQVYTKKTSSTKNLVPRGVALILLAGGITWLFYHVYN